MFQHVQRESAARLVQVREYLNHIKSYGTEHTLTIEPSYVLAQRGLFFVYLYGVVEYTVKNTVSTCINEINNQSYKYIDLKPLLFSLILDGDFNALFQIGSDKKWEKRWKILSSISSEEIVNISNNLMPTDGKNIRYAQLQSIWKSFCIEKPILPRVDSGGILNEIVEKRNKIAHGEETPEEVGRRFSFDDLERRFEVISELCSYIIAVFEDYLVEKKYIREQ
ncbi:MAE_28990/MAE_18760 family HEPN-like nuclease [Paenibacillus arenilitoris]|uniref:RiboL-PSP-HEPN domain-containing protein n=1 Tax=Paenibacillus arenilitoris TaxID=2772299 RepID=A0A927CV43_9BACL|nr:MAE_28990/MAE_18760 family HEPN-like nuclease [Paenibacillus arenilitoris]MBD2872396.1 hypothetical protein [Paenibacillus arenilitoris]